MEVLEDEYQDTYFAEGHYSEEEFLKGLGELRGIKGEELENYRTHFGPLQLQQADLYLDYEGYTKWYSWPQGLEEPEPEEWDEEDNPIIPQPLTVTITLIERIPTWKLPGQTSPSPVF